MQTDNVEDTRRQLSNSRMNRPKSVCIGTIFFCLFFITILTCTSEEKKRQAAIIAKTKAVQEMMNKILQGQSVSKTASRRVVVKLYELIPDFAIIIPIAPEINGQKITKIKYKPLPNEIIERQGQKYYFSDGAPSNNFGVYFWEATFSLLPRTEILIIDSLVLDFTGIPPETTEIYTGSAGIFGLGTHEVEVAADEAVGSEKRIDLMIKRIIEYVKNRIEIKRSTGFAKASDILKRGTGNRDEYLFVISALCRQKDIPTRIVATKKQRLLHVFIPPYGWLLIDPAENQFFIGGDLVLHSQSDYRNFLENGWDFNCSVRRSGTWIRAGSLAQGRINETVDR